MTKATLIIIAMTWAGGNAGNHVAIEQVSMQSQLACEQAADQIRRPTKGSGYRVDAYCVAGRPR